MDVFVHFNGGSEGIKSRLISKLRDIISNNPGAVESELGISSEVVERINNNDMTIISTLVEILPKSILMESFGNFINLPDETIANIEKELVEICQYCGRLLPCEDCPGCMPLDLHSELPKLISDWNLESRVKLYLLMKGLKILGQAS
jgi:hypothetical protein